MWPAFHQCSWQKRSSAAALYFQFLPLFSIFAGTHLPTFKLLRGAPKLWRFVHKLCANFFLNIFSTKIPPFFRLEWRFAGNTWRQKWMVERRCIASGTPLPRPPTRSCTCSNIAWTQSRLRPQIHWKKLVHPDLSAFMASACPLYPSSLTAISTWWATHP